MTRKPRKRKAPPQVISKKDVELQTFMDHLILTEEQLEAKYPSNPKMGAPTKYDYQYHPRAVYYLCVNFGVKVRQLCDFFGINPATFYLWIETYPNFSKQYRAGMDGWNNGNAENALIKRALGYNFREERHERKLLTKVDGKPLLDDNGKKQYEMVMVSYTNKHQTADTKALSMWLMNRDRKRWKSVETRVNEFKGQIEHKHRHSQNLDLSALPEKTLEALLDLENIIDITPEPEEE